MRRTAFISGGGTGIGLAVAKALADDGTDITLFGRRRAPLEQAAAQITAAGGVARWYQADLCRPAEVESAASAALAACGGTLDLLVNNAGLTGTGHPWGLASIAENWQTQWRANVLPPVLLTEAVRRHLRRPGGRVVTISSYGAFLPGNAPYSSAKAALHTWMYSLAAELGGKQITVNTVAPGFVDGTDNEAAAHIGEAAHRSLVDATLLRRAGRPQDVAAAVRWLGSADACHVTGQILHVNGGAVLSRG
ncbi:SDR family NAD(P)-dependent oxidoreductase [Streptomyces sp. NPDC020707]|jgi:3-oxoacyl-[acyl-carrier protein] reductase|uniref:SDR family oxidoreductase n=1 Tax=Streptomyces ortus TaxID=2867268 RepID=A0ABT3VIU1_9ACTN|nr:MULTISPECIES: SDR family oxidoreductase [Streptomyces]MCX4238849.1 SDR family oxidoreductase [Streptomyces ortus]